MYALLDVSTPEAAGGFVAAVFAAIGAVARIMSWLEERERRKRMLEIGPTEGHRMPGDDQPYDAGAYERAQQQAWWSEKRALLAQLEAAHEKIARHDHELKLLGETWERRLRHELAAAERRCQAAIEEIRAAAPPSARLPPAPRTPGSSPGLPPIVEEDTRRTGRPPRLSDEANAERRPLPPNTLADALQDRIHETSGRLLAARPIKPAKPKT